MSESARSNLIDVTVELHASTEKAVLVSDDGDKNKAVWLPRSQIEIAKLPNRKGPIYEVTLPEWLAQDKGLI